MPTISISKKEVDGLLDTQVEKKFQDSRRSYWRVEEDGYVHAQSVYWLYCWAETGMGHRKAALECLEMFNQIFPFTFEYFKGRVPDDYPRRYRYMFKRDDYIDQELDRLLKA